MNDGWKEYLKYNFFLVLVYIYYNIYFMVMSINLFCYVYIVFVVKWIYFNNMIMVSRIKKEFYYF